MVELHRYIFIITTTVSVGLIIASLIIPPTGIVDPSVLTAVGELFAFAALGEASYTLRHKGAAKITKGDTTFELESNQEEIINDMRRLNKPCTKRNKQ